MPANPTGPDKMLVTDGGDTRFGHLHGVLTHKLAVSSHENSPPVLCYDDVRRLILVGPDKPRLPQRENRADRYHEELVIAALDVFTAS